MSLQIWLPLNGNLNNQGLSDVTVTNYGGTINNSGKMGKCYNFDGNNHYIELSSMYIPEQFSISIWGKWTSFNNWSRLIDFGTTHGGTGHGFLIANAGTSNELIFSYRSGTDSMNQSLGNIIELNKWYNFIITVDYCNFTIYINGVGTLNFRTADLIGGRQLLYNYLGKSNWYGDGYLNGSINDFRVYDHCLSAKEIKEISKGLVLHYKLDNNGMGEPNLLKNTSSNTVNNKYVITTASTDGYYCPGFYYNGFDTDKTYTLTVECDGTLNTGHGALRTPSERYWTIWLYYHSTPFSDNDYNRFETPICYTSSSSGFKKISDTKYSWTFNPSKTNGSIRFNTYSDGITPITVNFWNVKVEEGTKATPWCPNKQDTLYTTLGLNNNIEYDCSGYGNDGTKIGTIISDTNTSKYDSCIKLNGTGNAILTPFNSCINDEWSISVWFYKTSIGTNGYQTIFGGQSGFEIEARNASESSPVVVAWNWGKGTIPYEFNKWNHLVVTRNSSETKWYLNGELKLTGQSGTIPSGNYYVGAWRDASSQNYEGSLSDFRVYSSVLSLSDIKELYQTSASIDKQGNVYCAEYKEV